VSHTDVEFDVFGLDGKTGLVPGFQGFVTPSSESPGHTVYSPVFHHDFFER
jgi:hypothetical protein